jgi:hypothetical protein
MAIIIITSGVGVLINIGVTWLITVEGGPESAIGIRNSDTPILRPVKRRLFIIFFCLYTTEIIVLKIFYLPLFSSVAKKIFLGRKNIWVGGICHSLRHPSYAYGDQHSCCLK